MGEAKRKRAAGVIKSVAKHNTIDNSIEDLEREVMAGNVDAMATIAKLKSPAGTSYWKIYAMNMTAKDLAHAIVHTMPELLELIRKESMN
jgi:hypothetical protein